MSNKTGGMLWITCMRADGNDEEIVRLGYPGDGARRTFEHAKRVILGADQGSASLAEGDLILTLLTAEGDVSDADPLRIPAAMADWFMDLWLKVPADWRATA